LWRYESRNPKEIPKKILGGAFRVCFGFRDPWVLVGRFDEVPEAEMAFRAVSCGFVDTFYQENGFA
jgi:hypothetical protein